MTPPIQLGQLDDFYDSSDPRRSTCDRYDSSDLGSQLDDFYDSSDSTVRLVASDDF